MKVAINYSRAALTLLRAGKIQVDVWKCPAWDDLLAEAQQSNDVYIHFPLAISPHGIMHTEKKTLVDLDEIERQKDESGTPLVNVHFSPHTRDYPNISVDSMHPAHIQQVMDDALRALEPIIQRFGAENVIIENVPDSANTVMRPAIYPENIKNLITQSGCGFLLDISHARIAADFIGMDEKAYLQALPVQHIREIHVTGIHTLDDNKLAQIQALGIHADIFQRLKGRRMDHLPFTEDDWNFTAWALDHIKQGDWAAPWVVSFEYGGVGGIWEIIGEPQVMLEQVPRLYDLVASIPA